MTPKQRLAIKGSMSHDGPKNTKVVIEVPMSQLSFGLQSPHTDESVEPIRIDEPISLGRTPWEPRHAIVHGELGVTFHFDLPDVVNPDIHIACSGDRLQVWGNRPLKARPHFPDETSNRWHGPFAIEIPLPPRVDVSRMDRQLDLGVLSLYFPFAGTPPIQRSEPS